MFRLKGKQPVKIQRKQPALQDHETLPAGSFVRVKKGLERGQKFCQLRMGSKALLQVTSKSVLGDVTSCSAVEFLCAMLMNGSTYGAVKEAKTALIAGDSVNVNGLNVTLKDLYARRPGSRAADGFAD